MAFAARCILGIALILSVFGLNACSSSRVPAVSHAESASGAALVERLNRLPQTDAGTEPSTGFYWCNPDFCAVDFDASEEALAADAADCVDAASRLEALTPGSLHGSHNYAYEEYFRCMAALAELGVDARIVADIIRPLLHSPEPLVRVHAIELLGHIGDETSGPSIRPFLDSPIWQDVLAAAQTLSKLQGVDDHSLMEVAASHWWREVRSAAQMAGLQHGIVASSTNARSDRLLIEDEIRTFRLQRFGPIDRRDVRDAICPSEAFDFQGTSITFDPDFLEIPEPVQIGDQILSVRATGYEGEYVLDVGPPDEQQLFLRLHAIGLFSISATEALVVTGIEHMSGPGYLLHIVMTDTGPRAIRLADLHFDPYWAAKLGPNLYGVRTMAGFFVFNETGMLGAAACVPGPLPDPRPR